MCQFQYQTLEKDLVIRGVLEEGEKLLKGEKLMYQLSVEKKEELDNFLIEHPTTCSVVVKQRQILLVNENFEKRTGFSAQQLVDGSITGLIHFQDLHKYFTVEQLLQDMTSLDKTTHSSPLANSPSIQQLWNSEAEESERFLRISTNLGVYHKIFPTFWEFTLEGDESAVIILFEQDSTQPQPLPNFEIVLSMDFNIIHVSPACLNFVEYSPFELNGTNFSLLCPQDGIIYDTWQRTIRLEPNREFIFNGILETKYLTKWFFVLTVVSIWESDRYILKGVIQIISKVLFESLELLSEYPLENSEDNFESLLFHDRFYDSDNLSIASNVLRFSEPSPHQYLEFDFAPLTQDQSQPQSVETLPLKENHQPSEVNYNQHTTKSEDQNQYQVQSTERQIDIESTPFVHKPQKRRFKKTPVVGEKACESCGTSSTPEWRKGPKGPKTLCNACGLHFAKLTRQKKGLQSKPPQPFSFTFTPDFVTHFASKPPSK